MSPWKQFRPRPAPQRADRSKKSATARRSGRGGSPPRARVPPSPHAGISRLWSRPRVRGFPGSFADRCPRIWRSAPPRVPGTAPSTDVAEASRHDRRPRAAGRISARECRPQFSPSWMPDIRTFPAIFLVTPGIFRHSRFRPPG